MSTIAVHSIKGEVRGMNRIIVLKKGIVKKEVLLSGCCFGAFIPMR